MKKHLAIEVIVIVHKGTACRKRSSKSRSVGQFRVEGGWSPRQGFRTLLMRCSS